VFSIYACTLFVHIVDVVNVFRLTSRGFVSTFHFDSIWYFKIYFFWFAFVNFTIYFYVYCNT